MVTLFLLTVLAAADAPAKPACSASLAGRYWPEEANGNRSFAAALAPYGFPEICTHVRGRWLWRSHTVSLGQLRIEADRKRKPARKQASAALLP